MAENATVKKERIDQYEGMFLLGQNASAELDASLKLVRGIVERHGGQILVIKRWDERKLNYEIEGNKRGTYIITYFKAPRQAITGIERDVKLSEDVLRVLVTRADHLNQKEMEAVEPQPIIREERPSWERDDRPPRGDRPMGDRPPREDRPFVPLSERPAGDRPAGDRPPRPPRRDEPVPDGANKD